jgi:uncharacterized protein (DUF2164 family)
VSGGAWAFQWRVEVGVERFTILLRVWHSCGMPVSLPPEKLKQLQISLKRYLVENVDSETGDLKAKLLLDFCLQEIGAVVYNQAIADAQAYFQARVGDLDGVCYQHEFTYWQRK